MEEKYEGEIRKNTAREPKYHRKRRVFYGTIRDHVKHRNY